MILLMAMKIDWRWATELDPMTVVVWMHRHFNNRLGLFSQQACRGPFHANACHSQMDWMLRDLPAEAFLYVSNTLIPGVLLSHEDFNRDPTLLSEAYLRHLVLKDEQDIKGDNHDGDAEDRWWRASHGQCQTPYGFSM